MNITKSAMVPKHVPGRAHYSTQYLGRSRIFSFAHQIEAVLSYGPQKVLEVGVGTGIVTAALRAAGVQVTTLDLQPALEPDLVGSVTSVPVEDRTFDIVLCCQVLEHLPFQQFGQALREIRRISRCGLILSLPDVERYLAFELNLPILGRRRWSSSIHRWPRGVIPPSRFKEHGHYWEIGYSGFEYPRVLRVILENGWNLNRTWRVPENPWHRFFALGVSRGEAD